MRLISATVKNYRLHKEFMIDFDPEMTVIVGPNETGKSTLIEAIHSGLFLKARAGGQALSRIRSKLYPGHPEVTVCFEAKGKRCEVTKIFRGQSGTALVKMEGSSYSGDEAEYILGELLGETPVGGKAASRLNLRWNHLWVWQGQGGKYPGRAVEERNEVLIRRLQQEQGAIIQQSEKDAAVADYFRKEYSRFFTDKGQISKKKGNELYEKKQRLEKLEALVEEARARVDRLEAARGEYLRALKEKEEKGKELEKTQLELQQVVKKLAECEELSKQADEHKKQFEELKAEKAALERVQEEITALKREIKEMVQGLGPMEKGLQELEAAIASKQKSLDRLRSSHQNEVRKRLQAAETELELLSLCREALRADTEITRLEKKIERVEDLEGQLKNIERRITELPKVTEAQRERILQLSSDIKSAEARLDALSARIEVSESELAVQVDGRPVPVGGHVTVRRTCEVTVGESTRITVTPGGGTSLEDAASKLDRLEEDLQGLLRQIGVDSVEQALSAYEAAREERGRLEAVKTRLDELNGKELRHSLESARKIRDEAESKIQRLSSKAEGWVRPSDLVEISDRISKAEARVKELKNEEEAILKEANNLHEELEADRQRREETQREIRQIQEALTEARAKLSVKQEEAGDDKKRGDRLIELGQQMEKERLIIDAIERKIAEHEPERLKLSREKYKKAEERLSSEIRQAREDMLRAETLLEFDGSLDPQAELDERMAAAEQARREYEAVYRRANAIRRVHELFLEERQRLADRYSKPLSQKISDYARVIFGSLSRVDTRLSENSLHSITLFHHKFGDTEFDFEALSGGAKEQLAAAVRLAVAEILAQEHDGCLPVVFDDSFTNSDRDRLQSIQDMLFKASKRGLQIIVLSSSPEDYGTMPGRVVRMEPPVVGMQADMTKGLSFGHSDGHDDGLEIDAVSAFSGNREGLAAYANLPQDQERFLALLKNMGGSSGNKALMERLGWDQARYEETKSRLLSMGLIRTGHGPGGSVSVV